MNGPLVASFAYLATLAVTLFVLGPDIGYRLTAGVWTFLFLMFLWVEGPRAAFGLQSQRGKS